MERFKAPTKFIQYQLWQDCRNGCKFCSEKNQPSINKIVGLTHTLNKLDDPEVFDYQEVGFIGGELFDNQLDDLEVRELFYELFRKVSKMHFDKIYIATALIYDINVYLIPFLNFIKELGIMDKVLLCTSYDLKYRFNKPGKKELWENNMLELYKLFPELKTHVETILTQYFIDAVLSNEFNITDFCNKFHTRIDYIEPASGMYYNNKEDCAKDLPDFFPTKASYIKFLVEKGVKSKEIDLTCLISYQIRASRIYHLDSGQYVCYEDRRQPGYRVECLDRTKKYEIGFIDSDDSMEDIADKVCEMINDL